MGCGKEAKVNSPERCAQNKTPFHRRVKIFITNPRYVQSYTQPTDEGGVKIPARHDEDEDVASVCSQLTTRAGYGGITGA